MKSWKPIFSNWWLIVINKWKTSITAVFVGTKFGTTIEKTFWTIGFILSEDMTIHFICFQRPETWRNQGSKMIIWMTSYQFRSSSPSAICTTSGQIFFSMIEQLNFVLWIFGGTFWLQSCLWWQSCSNSYNCPSNDEQSVFSFLAGVVGVSVSGCIQEA